MASPSSVLKFPIVFCKTTSNIKEGKKARVCKYVTRVTELFIIYRFRPA